MIMWNANDHTNDDNLRWAWLRAIEWGAWPIFISQPVAPVAMLFFHWWPVVLTTFIVTVFWTFFISRTIVVPAMAFWGAVVVRLKWVTCPMAAYMLWERGLKGTAIVAFFWPLLIVFLLPFGTPAVGEIQKMFLRCLGYESAKRP
jgi:hypothetical protein